MSTPVATYRLQFREGMTFDRAAQLVPYWRELGISHLYASPIFTAQSGSTHGYDLTRYDEIEPELGGLEGLERLSGRLKEAGMGLILDIVPNHMAASTENPWWRSVLKWGAASPYARHFDIDWSRRLTLPILGRPFDEAIAAGEVTLQFDAPTASLVAAYFDHRIPLDPATYAEILGEEHPGTAEIEEAARAGPGSEEKLGDLMRSLAAEPTLHYSLERLSEETARLALALEVQPWTLTFWQDARRDLSYRRFFEITGLVGVRVEDPPVFDDVHRLTLDLVQRGIVDGLRVDHVDGLADPTSYLQRLREAAGPDVYITVEKILMADERVPESWPVAGTTGYEVIAAISELFVDGEKAEALDRAYAEMLPEPPDFSAEERKAKAFIVHERLETELNGLARLAEEACDGRFTYDSLREAIASVAIAFPVYRTYAGAGGPTDEDRAVLERVRERLSEMPQSADSQAIDAVLTLLSSTPATEFTTRFQQMTGPVMAKAVEDTLFYRFNRLIALNEVAGDPAATAGSLERFHDEMERRQKEQPHGLSAATTHDTKRGEDARARLLVLSEIPDLFAEAVARWRSINRDAVRDLDGGPAPEAAVEWLLYQALIGVWPESLEPFDEAGLEALRARFLPYVEKALREAKLRTDWLAVDEDYEAAVKAYAERLLSTENAAFLEDFRAFMAPVIEAGRHNSLVAAVVRLTAPGIPDIYQGSEGHDFSLADPDNRRAVDFAALQGILESHLKGPAFDKLAITRGLLALRRQTDELFTIGEYIPIASEGPAARNIVAFLRREGDRVALTVALRLPVALISAGADAAAETRLVLGAIGEERQWHDVFAAQEAVLGTTPSAGALLKGHPAAVFLSPAPQP